MASESNGKPSGTASQKTRPFGRLEDDEKDWNYRMDDAEVSGREAMAGTTVSGSDDKFDPMIHLRQRLSTWGRIIQHFAAIDSSTNSSIDPNFPEDKRESKILDTSNFDDDEVFTNKEVEDSPYPEVRAAVRNYDEDVPANTIRAWTIGLMLVFLGASMNTLFSLRQPAIALGPLVAQIIAWPMGHGSVYLSGVHSFSQTDSNLRSCSTIIMETDLMQMGEGHA